MFRMSGTHQRPTVVIDIEKGFFEISGSSIPENPMDVFTPIFDHLNRYMENPLPLTELHFRLDYFNTSTSKLMLDMIHKMESLTDENGREVKIKWFYREADDDMMEIGEDFANLCRLPIEIIPYS
ncbi:protein of unknown function [Marivirga sericea]|uniref:SiaC family regulatory phosphoprotein domain-containing protein n=2 Tax=Marivirga sericea TaxID=1028 RepID=A0A1X7KME9_9BACT|nr:protein of unknown function [Marivirga sericea]